MKHVFSITLIAAIVLASVLMSACGPVYSTSYSYVPPKSYRGRMCLNQCLSQKSMCQNNCSMLKQSCHMQANAMAEPAYHAYLHQMKRQGKTPWRNISYFADYSSCRDNCGCQGNYRQCYTSCGGRIIPHTVCTMFCPKPIPTQ